MLQSPSTRRPRHSATRVIVTFLSLCLILPAAPSALAQQTFTSVQNANEIACRASSQLTSKVIKPDAKCQLSLGCQRSFCNCLGTSFDSATLQCIAAAPGSSSARPSTCSAVSRCHYDAFTCYSQAAVLTAQVPDCATFSHQLYEDLIGAAVGLGARLRLSCEQFRCDYYNTTARLAPNDTSAFQTCFINATDQSCPNPTSSRIRVGIMASDWGTVLSSSSRQQLFDAALQQDVATAVGTAAHLNGFDVINGTAIILNLTISVETAQDYVESSLAENGAGWLASTTISYKSYGGRGEFTVKLLPPDPASPTDSIPATPPGTDGRPSFPPDILGQSELSLGVDGNTCNTACGVGIAVGVLLAFAFVAAMGIFVTIFGCNKSAAARAASPLHSGSPEGWHSNGQKNSPSRPVPQAAEIDRPQQMSLRAPIPMSPGAKPTLSPPPLAIGSRPGSRPGTADSGGKPPRSRPHSAHSENGMLRYASGAELV
jgi:hypothetical protein